MVKVIVEWEGRGSGQLIAVGVRMEYLGQQQQQEQFVFCHHCSNDPGQDDQMTKTLPSSQLRPPSCKYHRVSCN